MNWLKYLNYLWVIIKLSLKANLKFFDSAEIREAGLNTHEINDLPGHWGTGGCMRCQHVETAALCAPMCECTGSLNNLALLVGAEGSISDSISSKFPSGQWDCSVQIRCRWSGAAWFFSYLHMAKSLDPKWTSQFLADRTGLWDILHRWMPCSAPEGGTHHTYLWPPKVRQGSNLNWSEPEPPLQALGRGRETARAELPACPKAAA